MTAHAIEIVPGETVEVPDPRQTPKATRRTFTAAYKARILREYEAGGRVERGELMRREGLYSSLITKWRGQADRAVTEALSAPTGRPRHDPLVKENQRLREELSRAEEKLVTAEKVIEVQGKLSALLDHLATNRATPNSEQ